MAARPASRPAVERGGVGESRAEVIVVGAGLAGLASAYFLARAGVRVCVLEAASAPASEASAQNAGMVRRLCEEPIERSLALRSHRMLAPLCPSDGHSPALAASHQSGGEVEATFATDPDLAGATLGRRTGGLLLLGSEPTRLHDAAAHLALAGAPTLFLGDLSQNSPAEFIDALSSDGKQPLRTDPLHLLPWLRGTSARAGFLDPDALVVDAAALCQGLLRALRRRGVEVRCGVAVTELVVRGGRCQGVALAGGGGAAADAVLLATGAWGSALLARAGLRRPLLPLRRTLWQSSAAPLADAAAPWVWLDDIGLYLRPQAGGWLASPCDERLDLPTSPPTAGRDGHSRRAAATETLALQLAKLERWLPVVANEVAEGRLRWRAGWSGLRTFAPDRLPLIGPDAALPGLHFCTGLGGAGVSCGVAAAEAAAALLLGEATPWLDSEAVRPDRPAMARLPYVPDGDVARARLLDVRQAMAGLQGPGAAPGASSPVP